MDTQLKLIIDVLKNKTAFSFADEKLSQVKKGVLERKENYYDYMYQVFSGSENPTLDECEINAKAQYVSEYARCCDLFTGWIKNGSIFILDRRNKFVLFLYQKDNIRHKAITNYNPLNYDCYEWSMPNKQFFKGLETGEFDLSKNENDIINECNKLINPILP